MTTVFAQLMDFLPAYEFLERYRGDYKWRGFSCWDQFLCLAFAQLTYRESLRDIEACLRSVQPKLYPIPCSMNPHRKEGTWQPFQPCPDASLKVTPWKKRRRTLERQLSSTSKRCSDGESTRMPA